MHTNTRNTLKSTSLILSVLYSEIICVILLVNYCVILIHFQNVVSFHPETWMATKFIHIFIIFRQFIPVVLLDSQRYRINPVKTQQYILVHGSATCFNQTLSKHIRLDDDHVSSKHVADLRTKCIVVFCLHLVCIL